MISRLHFITQDLPELSHAQQAEIACKGGVDWVQLRLKGRTLDELKKIAEATRSVCRTYGAKLIINDHVDVAKEIEADGVHLGKEDMNPKEARKILGNGFIIGGSTNSVEDVRRQIGNGCDYVGVGPYRFTSTKEKLNPVLGLEGIQAIAEKFGKQIPLIAIGGIKLEDATALMQTGIHGIAVSSAMAMAKNIGEASKKFVGKISPLRH